MRTLLYAGRRAVGLRGEAAELLRHAQRERRWSNVTLAIGIAVVGALSIAGFFASLIAPLIPMPSTSPSAC